MMDVSRKKQKQNPIFSLYVFVKLGFFSIFLLGLSACTDAIPNFEDLMSSSLDKPSNFNQSIYYLQSGTSSLSLSGSCDSSSTGLYISNDGSNYSDVTSLSGFNSGASDIDCSDSTFTIVINSAASDLGFSQTENKLKTIYVKAGADGGSKSDFSTFEVEYVHTAAQINIASSTYPTSESSSSVDFVVSLDSAPLSNVTVDYGFADGTASGSGTDYLGADGILTFAANETSKTVSVSISPDSITESTESFTVSLSSPSINAVVGSVAVASFTISDDDPTPVVGFSSSSTSVGEDSGSFNIPVVLDRAAEYDVTVEYTITDSSAIKASDYSSASYSGTLTFSSMSTSENISITLLGDDHYEGSETFSVTLSNPSGASAGVVTSFTTTITDAEAKPTLSFSGATSSVSESGGSANITVLLSGKTQDNVEFNYVDAGTGLAVSGTDFTAPSSTHTIAGGSTIYTLTFGIISNTTYNPNKDIDFSITLNTSNASLGSPVSHELTITDDDDPAIISIDSVNVPEGSGAVFTVSLDQASGANVTFDWVTTNGSALAGEDYVSGSGTGVSITAGNTTKLITINTKLDPLVFDHNESFNVVLSNVSGAGDGTLTGVGTILEPTPSNPLVLSSTSVTAASSFDVTVYANSLSSTTTFYTNSGCTVSVNSVTPTGYEEVHTITGLVDGVNSYYMKTTSPSGVSACENTGISVNKQSAPPSAPSAIAMNSPATTTDIDRSPEFIVSGVIASGQIQIHSNATCSQLVGAAGLTGGSTALVTANDLGVGTHTIYMKQINEYGVSSSCSTGSINYTVTSGFDFGVTSITAASGGGFAAILSDGSAVSWGDNDYGGNSSGVASQIDGTIDVASIYSTRYAFAALRTDGSVVAWGDSMYGGFLNAAASQVDGTIPVINIIPNSYAFASIRNDGSVVTWGYSAYGGTSTGVAADINGTIDVVSIAATSGAFAALRNDGSVITWGQASMGGDSSTVAASIDGTIDVVEITATGGGAFAARRNDGSVITWGSSTYGGDSSSVSASISSGVSKIYSNNYSFAALKSDGSVVTWGHSNYGGNSSAVSASLASGVSKIASNFYAYSAIKADGSVVTWGYPTQGGDSSGVAAQISSNVTNVYSTRYSFAARKSDGSLVTWGDSAYGGNSSAVSSLINGTVPVTNVFSGTHSFSALRNDGSLVSWGGEDLGFITSHLVNDFDGTIDVTDVVYTDSSAAALRADNSVITWGNPATGGASDPLFFSNFGVIKGTAFNGSATAIIKSDGSVKVMGSGTSVNTSSVASQIDGTIPVEKLFSNFYSFVALRNDGSLVGWGGSGGNLSSVASQVDGTVDVVNVFSNDYAYAALRTDGALYTWGSNSYGGDSSAYAADFDGTVDVVKVITNARSFAAFRSDGKAYAWGDASFGGSASLVLSDIDGTIPVVSLAATSRAYAAVRNDGSVITWGYGSYGGSSSLVTSQISSGVVKVYGNNYAFAAVKQDGSVVVWGNASYGGSISSVASQLDGTIPVVKIFNTPYAFAALRQDGSVVTWGGGGNGGNSSSVAALIDGTVDVVDIASNFGAFAALRQDGSVVTWGIAKNGGDSSGVASFIDGTVDVAKVINVPGHCFAAIRTDGKATIWGSEGCNSVASNYDLSSAPAIIDAFGSHGGLIFMRNNGTPVDAFGWAVPSKPVGPLAN